MSEMYSPPRTAGQNIIPVLLDELQKINPDEFSKYLMNPNKFIEDCLHSVKEDEKKIAKIEQIKKTILDFDSMYAKLKIPFGIGLNILVVENKPTDDTFVKKLKSLKTAFGKNLKFYLIWEKLSDFEKALQESNSIVQYIDSCIGDPYEIKVPQDITLTDVDLILQDIFLEAGGISGSDFAELYFDAAPQAMVFFLTNMDIETLAASGYDNKVDRLIGKDRMKGIMKCYYDRFHELYGPLLWQVFVDSKERNGNASLTDRASVRKLLGNIRTWTIAPKILFHGFALPEMVDHEFRHTVGLWKMANNILGPFLERMPKDIMPDEDRILLALAIWLHDIGHRGDEHHFVPMEIRENHGAISESLILEHFESLGIGWLKDLCDNEKCRRFKCCCGTVHRNKKEGCFNEEICSLRKLGLICRYHQSTAPMTVNKLKTLIPKLKFPSPYCIVGMEDLSHEVGDDHDFQIEQWLDMTKDFGWLGTDIRTLKEFKDSERLLNLTGMLRWLDALHTHSEKVGSVLEVKSFLSYLKMRKKYCEKRIEEIDNLLDKTVVGSEAYLSALAERFRLDKYSELLDVQGIHLWRSGLVRHIKGEWFWYERHEEWAFRILFELYDNDSFENDEELKATLSLKVIKKQMGIKNEKDMSEIAKAWSCHVWEEIINSEIEGQIDCDRPFFDNYFGGINIYYSYSTLSGDPFSICERKCPITI